MVKSKNSNFLIFIVTNLFLMQSLFGMMQNFTSVDPEGSSGLNTMNFVGIGLGGGLIISCVVTRAIYSLKNRLLLYAAKKGSCALLKTALDLDADVEITNEEGWTPLMLAARVGHARVLQKLIEHNADVESSGEIALVAAVKGNKHEAVDVLLSNGVSPCKKNWRGTPLLVTAAENGSPLIVYQLLDKNADPNGSDGFGQTALMAAARKGHSAVVDVLLHKGADRKQVECLGRTALHYAACNNQTKIFLSLMRGSSNINPKDVFGRTPLSVALLNGHEECKKELVGLGTQEKKRKSLNSNERNFLAAHQEKFMRLSILGGESLRDSDQADSEEEKDEVTTV